MLKIVAKLRQVKFYYHICISLSVVSGDFLTVCAQSRMNEPKYRHIERGTSKQIKNFYVLFFNSCLKVGRS